MHSMNKKILCGLILISGLAPLFSQGWGRNDNHMGWDRSDGYSDRAGIWQKDLEGEINFVRNDLVFTVGNKDYLLNLRDRSVVDALDSGMQVSISGYEYRSNSYYSLEPQTLSVNGRVYVLSRGYNDGGNSRRHHSSRDSSGHHSGRGSSKHHSY